LRRAQAARPRRVPGRLTERGKSARRSRAWHLRRLDHRFVEAEVLRDQRGPLQPLRACPVDDPPPDGDQHGDCPAFGIGVGGRIRQTTQPDRLGNDGGQLPVPGDDAAHHRMLGAGGRVESERRCIGSGRGGVHQWSRLFRLASQHDADPGVVYQRREIGEVVESRLRAAPRRMHRMRRDVHAAFPDGIDNGAGRRPTQPTRAPVLGSIGPWSGPIQREPETESLAGPA